MLKKKQPIDFSRGVVGLAGERALLRHFCALGIRQALDRYQNQWSRVDVHSSDLEFPSKLASLASTLLGDGKWTPEAIENLLQVVALYGHIVLEIPDRIDLVRHLRQTLRGETALHTLKQRYRDHFFHTLEVCFLGFALLNSRPKKNSDKTMADLLVKRGNVLRAGKKNDTFPPLAKDTSELLAQWWIASLVHDTAYGIDIFDGTLKLLDFFNNRKDVKSFIGKAKDTVGDLGKSLAELTPELKDDNALKKGDHGVIAAASLAEVLHKIGGGTKQRFWPAVRAIAFHNTRHPKVDAGADPIAALLILCDTVQEWGRSSLGFNRSPSVLLSRLMEAALTPPEEQFGPVKRYGLSLSHKARSNQGVYHWNKSNELDIHLDYGKDALKEFKTIFTWADTTYNLQRVDFRSWGIVLRVQISVPRPKSADQLSQFEHFGNFVREQEVRFAQQWFHVAYQANPKKAIAYQLLPPEQEATIDEKNTGREIITFNLPELGREFLAETPLMGGTIGDFVSTMVKWPVFSREQAEAPPDHGAPIC